MTHPASPSPSRPDNGELVFFHNPWSRATVIHWLLEELGVPYSTRIIDIQHPDNIPEDYRATQAHKKVPAIRHNGVVVTERAAIALYLAETFPEAGLAPAIGSPERAAYLTWLVYSDAVVDPAMSAHHYQWQYEKGAVSFGLFEDMTARIERHLAGNDYIAGNTFTAADCVFGGMLYWLVEMFKGIPKLPVHQAYFDRISARPAFQRTMNTSG